MLQRLPPFLFLGFGSLFVLSLSAAEKWTANFYQSAPQEYLGKEVRLRVASLTPVPELTAADKGFVWMEAVTGKPPKEDGRILLRIPQADSAKLAKVMNLPSSSGRWLEGTFLGHDSGPILSKSIKERAPYYLQVLSSGSSISTGSKPEDLETASGSLTLSSQPKSPNISLAAPEAAPLPRPTAPSQPEGPKAVLFRNKNGEPLQLREAQRIKFEPDFCEIVGVDGKISILGRSLVVGVLPLPPAETTPAPEQVDAALRIYADKIRSFPEASSLLAEFKASWEKFSPAAMASADNVALPELEEVETAAGVEEPEVVSGYPGWFGWGTLIGVLTLIFLVWLWSRPRSYLA